MTQIYDTKKEQERFILVGIETRADDDTDESLDELEELVRTAGGMVVGRLVQKRERAHSALYLGTGKILELKELKEELGATGIVCDDELSPMQLRNLVQEFDGKVMDRTLVILDIFAQHARTSEGRIQVELAQLKYQAVRLVGLRNSLSRQGGGIGTRGPGEKKLEMDKRLIHDRISLLKADLRNIEKNRDLQRKKREKDNIVTVSIVGYTNAGKSTLLNHLTNAQVLEEDKLFATLDTTTRELQLEAGQKILITDTVGFIRKLPHNLVEAFKSTLEEAKYADIILHVVDASHPMCENHMYVVYDTLRSLGVEDKVVVTAFNKQDKIEDKSSLKDFKADYSLPISAKTGEGMEELKKVLLAILRERSVYIETIIPYDKAAVIQVVRKKGNLLEENYLEEGIQIKAYVPMQVKESFLL